MTLAEAWLRLREHRDGFFWLALGLRNGDLFHFCALAHAFRERHDASHPLFLIVASDQQRQIASLYSDVFDEILLEPGLRFTREDCASLPETLGGEGDGRNRPIVLHLPLTADPSVPDVETLRTYDLTWFDAYKRLLRLPRSAVPRMPRRRPEAERAAAEFAAAVGMPAGTSVILFPYAQSLPVSAGSHLERLARDLAGEGRRVFTSVAPGEAPIPGTRGIFIPFFLLRELAERAGWAVAMRSGIADILASALCRKTFVYPDYREIVLWSTERLELARDAYQLPFDFAGAREEEFSRLVRSCVDFGRYTVGRPDIDRDIVAATEAAEVSITDRIRQRCPSAPDERVEVPAAGAILVRDVPSWDGSSLNEAVVTPLVRAMLEQDDYRVFGIAYVAERPLIEEVARDDLLAGRYLAGGGWHSLLFAEEQAVVALARSTLADFVLLREPVAVDAPLALGTLFDGRSGALSHAGVRPLAAPGFQFVSGWSFLEPWGMWSEGRSSLLKVTARPDAGRRVAVRIEGHYAVSEAFPHVAVAVHVGDRPALHVEAREGEPPPTITVPLGTGDDTVRTWHVELRFADLLSAADQIGGSDRRLLGIAVTSVAVVSDE